MATTTLMFHKCILNFLSLFLVVSYQSRPGRLSLTRAICYSVSKEFLRHFGWFIKNMRKYFFFFSFIHRDEFAWRQNDYFQTTFVHFIWREKKEDALALNSPQQPRRKQTLLQFEHGEDFFFLQISFVIYPMHIKCTLYLL